MRRARSVVLDDVATAHQAVASSRVTATTEGISVLSGGATDRRIWNISHPRPIRR